MSSNTPNLGLLKKDPMVDGNETFNIETMLNENWDKVDEAVGNVKVPDASLTEKGIVQLSSATNGTRENVAATEKAVSVAALQAKSYTDQQISLVTETGIPKLVSYPLLVTATADNQKVFEIPLDLFDANSDTLLVAINRAALDPTQYTVTNTVRNEAGEVTQRAKITLLSGVASTSEVTMVVLKNVPIGPEGAINGAVLAVDSIPINRVNGLQDQLDETFQAGNERKAEVVAALVAKGIEASTSENWAQLIPKITAVIRATGNATEVDLLVGRSASNTNGPFNGSMPDRSAQNEHMPGIDKTVWAGDRYFIKPPGGYYNGLTWVTAAEPHLIADNIRAGTSIGGIAGSLYPAMPATGAFDINNGDGRSPGTYDTLMYTIPAGVNLFSMSGTGEWTWRVQNVACKIHIILKDSNNMEFQALYGEPLSLTYDITFTLSPLIIYYPTRSVSISGSADQGAYIPVGPTIPANFNLNGPVRIIMRIVNTNGDNLFVYARCTKKYWQA